MLSEVCCWLCFNIKNQSTSSGSGTLTLVLSPSALPDPLLTLAPVGITASTVALLVLISLIFYCQLGPVGHWLMARVRWARILRLIRSRPNTGVAYSWSDGYTVLLSLASLVLWWGGLFYFILFSLADWRFANVNQQQVRYCSGDLHRN